MVRNWHRKAPFSIKGLPHKIIRIVAGYLSKMITTILVMDMKSAGFCSVDRKEAEEEREDKLSDDAMGFLRF